MKRFLFAIATALSLILPVQADDKPDFKALLSRYDEMLNFDKFDQSARVTIVQRKPGESDSVMQAQYFRRDAEKKTLILILKPEANRGQGLLMIGDDVTIFYDPESRKFSTVAKSGSFQDTNAKNSDFEAPNFSAKYDIVDATRESLVKKDTWALTLKAKTNDVSYPTIKIWLEVGSNLCLKMENYSLSNRLMSTTLYGKYVNIKGKYIPQIWRFEDNLKKGEITVISLESPSLEKLPENVFTKAYLEQVNQ
ncbi:MAG TPA: outer membrane lipoprotein-sorting protein [Rectinemataceae bacterium]|nr:outer membrane lipoprotein-sorting protein [Rectinemataceae bacterium]